MTFYPKGCPGSNQPGVPRQASRRYQNLNFDLENSLRQALVWLLTELKSMSYQQIKKNIFKRVAFGSVAFKRATFGIKSSKTLRVTASLPGYQLHTSAQPLCSITSIDLVAKLPSSVTNFGEAAGGLRERFIQRLILDGKKSTATKVFDESLQLLKKRMFDEP
jgi:hypothetical protein